MVDWVLCCRYLSYNDSCMLPVAKCIFIECVVICALELYSNTVVCIYANIVGGWQSQFFSFLSTLYASVVIELLFSGFIELHGIIFLH